MNSIIEALNKLIIALARKQIEKAFEQAEKEVLDLLLLGKTPDEIASEIKTTSRTVYNIMNKIKFKIKD